MDQYFPSALGLKFQLNSQYRTKVTLHRRTFSIEEYSAVYLRQTDFRNSNKMLLIIHPNDYVWIFKTYGYFKTYICYAMAKTTMQINYIISNL